MKSLVRLFLTILTIVKRVEAVGCLGTISWTLRNSDLPTNFVSGIESTPIINIPIYENTTQQETIVDLRYSTMTMNTSSPSSLYNYYNLTMVLPINGSTITNTSLVVNGAGTPNLKCNGMNYTVNLIRSNQHPCITWIGVDLKPIHPNQPNITTWSIQKYVKFDDSQVMIACGNDPTSTECSVGYDYMIPQATYRELANTNTRYTTDEITLTKTVLRSSNIIEKWYTLAVVPDVYARCSNANTTIVVQTLVPPVDSSSSSSSSSSSFTGSSSFPSPTGSSSSSTGLPTGSSPHVAHMDPTCLLVFILSCLVLV